MLSSCCISYSCGHCGRLHRPGSSWFFCAQCQSVGYCSRKHQRLALAEHRGNCRLAPSENAHASDGVGVLEQACSTSSLVEAAPEVKLRVLTGGATALDLSNCRAACSSLRDAVEVCAEHVHHAPWWLLARGCRQLLAAALALCPLSAILRAACGCRSWRRASEDRATWRNVRLSLNWGSDDQLCCAARALHRVARLHHLEAFPEDQHAFGAQLAKSAPCSPLNKATTQAPACFPASPSVAGRRTLEEMMRACSPLLICHHRGLAAALWDCAEVVEAKNELWMLQSKDECRLADPVRRALCLFLGANRRLLMGCAVLDVASAAGLVGLFAASFARSVTIAATSESDCRLAQLNGTFALSAMGAPRPRWSGTMKRRFLATPSANGRSVPVYVYNLPMVSRRGAEDLARRWQWESGTAMRVAPAAIAAPRFDVVFSAALGQDAVTGFLDLVAVLLVEGGHAIIALDRLRASPIAVLGTKAQEAGMSVEREELVQDPMSGLAARILLLRRVSS